MDTPDATRHTQPPAVRKSGLAFERCELLSSLLSTSTDLRPTPVPFVGSKLRAAFSA